MKFLSKPTELSSSLLPGKVISVSVGENTCAAVTGTLKWCTLLTGDEIYISLAFRYFILYGNHPSKLVSS